jgi:hypothetical protein
MNIFRRLFSTGPPQSEYDVFPNLAAILDAPSQVVSTLRSLPADKRETSFLDFLEKTHLGATVDVHDDEDSILRALQPCFPAPEHVGWDSIASEVHNLPIAPADDVLRVLIRAFKDEQSVLRVFASGHDYWTCIFVPQHAVHDFDTCIGRSSVVGYESPHDPNQA